MFNKIIIIWKIDYLRLHNVENTLNSFRNVLTSRLQDFRKEVNILTHTDFLLFLSDVNYLFIYN